MSTPFPYHLSDQSLTFYAGGKPTQILRDHPKFNEVLKLVNVGDEAAVALAAPAVKVAAELNDAIESLGDEQAKWFRRKAGEVKVTDWGVTIDGVDIHGHVVDRLLEVMGLGLDITPWVRFVQKLHQNPSSTSRNELYGWLEKSGMPITADGDFLAYKRVKGNYKDIHSGTFDNSVGKVVSMNRLDVDDDRNRTCSAGLHFCSKSYLPHFGNGTNQGTDKVVIVKINPADVVSIPSDYNDAKGRTWRYEVVDEISLADAGLRVWEPIVSDYDSDDDDDWYGDDYDEYEEDDTEEEDGDDTASRQLVGEVFAAYAGNSGNTNTKTGIARQARLFEASQILGRVVESFGDLTANEARQLIEEWT